MARKKKRKISKGLKQVLANAKKGLRRPDGRFISVALADKIKGQRKELAKKGIFKKYTDLVGDYFVREEQLIFRRKREAEAERRKKERRKIKEAGIEYQVEYPLFDDVMNKLEELKIKYTAQKMKIYIITFGGQRRRKYTYLKAQEKLNEEIEIIWQAFKEYQMEYEPELSPVFSIPIYFSDRRKTVLIDLNRIDFGSVKDTNRLIQIIYELKPRIGR